MRAALENQACSIWHTLKYVARKKIDEPVDFPQDGLDISQWVKMDYKAAGIAPIYDLYAVSNHYGSLNGGHYTATCRNSETNGWYDFNDGSVSSGRDINA